MSVLRDAYKDILSIVVYIVTEKLLPNQGKKKYANATVDKANLHWLVKKTIINKLA